MKPLKISRKPLITRLYIEDEALFDELRKRRPGVPDSQLVRELVHDALNRMRES